jgi:hypothetical protein
MSGLFNITQTMRRVIAHHHDTADKSNRDLVAANPAEAIRAPRLHAAKLSSRDPN